MEITMRQPLIPALTCAAVVMLTGSPAALAEDFYFKTPSGNINCGYFDYDGQPYVRCDINTFKPSGTPPPADCDLDWGDSFGIGAADLIGDMICHGDTVISQESRTLPYGSSWSEGGITCTSEKRGLTCKNRKGHGFFLSRAKQDVF